jgi:hypothetical protein
MTWIYLINYFRADVQYALGDNYAKVGPSQFQTAYEYLNNALQIRTEHVYQDRISYVAANLSYIAAADKQTDLARQLMTLSNDYNEKALQASPKNVLYYKTKVKNYYIYYQLTQDPTYLNNGLQTLDQALQLSPTDPKIPYSQALFYSALASEAKDPAEKKKYQDLSLERINYTLKLKRDYRDAFILKGQILTLYGDKQGAKDVYQFYLDRVGPGDAEMLKNIQDLNGTPAISPTPKPATKNDGK